MEDCLEAKVETKKEWVAPELKKIDVAEVTSLNTSGDDDGHTFS
jgi:hypothetical protein